MSVRYDLTAADILRILGFSKVQNPETIKKYEALEKKLNLTFPKSYKNFLVDASELLLLKDSFLFLNEDKITTLNNVFKNKCDIDKQYYFRIKSFEDISKYDTDIVEDDSEWDTDILENDYEWEVDISEDYLLIGSNTSQIWDSDDYEWYAVMFGIRRKDLKKKNPPVYINYHYHNYKVWHKFCDTLSEFLLTIVCDALIGKQNKNVSKGLKSEGWNKYQYKNIYDIQTLLFVKEIELNKMKDTGRRVKSIAPPKDYSAAFLMSCCYDKEEGSLYIIQYVGRAVQIDVISKNHEVVHADKNSSFYKEMFGSPLKLFTMQDFVEVLHPNFIYTGYERITQNGDDKVVINVYACDKSSKCSLCNNIEESRMGGACKKKVICPFCGEPVYGSGQLFSVEQWLGLRIKGVAILLKRTCMTYYCENPNCFSKKEPLKGEFNSLNIKNDMEHIDEIYTDFMEDKWNYRQVLELLGIEDGQK